jgi:hypothetical protein
MMGWAGLKVGRSLEVATSAMRNLAQDAGRQGGAIGKAALSKSVRK